MQEDNEGNELASCAQHRVLRVHWVQRVHRAQCAVCSVQSSEYRGAVERQNWQRGEISVRDTCTDCCQRGTHSFSLNLKEKLKLANKNPNKEGKNAWIFFGKHL